MSTAVVDDTHEARWRARLEDSARASYAAAVEVACPDHAYSQRELMAVLQSRWAKRPEVVHRIARLHESVQVGSRCIALALEAYGTLSSFDEANDAFIRVGTEVGGRAVRRARPRTTRRRRRADLRASAARARSMLAACCGRTPSA